MERSGRGIETALVPCAGLGTRLLPMTKVVPKELLPYQDRPLIQHVLEELHEAGVRTVVLVTRQDKALLESHLAEPYPYEHRAACPATVPEGLELRFAWQPAADGLSGALKAARPLMPEGPFLLVFPDQLLEGTPGAARQAADAYEGEGSLSTLVRIPAGEAALFPGASGLEVRGEPPVYDLVGLAGERTSPGAEIPGFEVRGFGRTVLEPRFFDHLPPSPEDGSFQAAFRSYTATGRHRALLLEGRPADLGTRAGYRRYAGGRR